MRENLEACLLNIFGVKKIKFMTAVYGQEQDCIYCDIEKSVQTIRDNKENVVVNGKISIYGTDKKNTSGFLHKKIYQMTPEMSRKFWFSPNEIVDEISNFEDMLKVYSVNFIFYYSGQFNLIKDDIASVDFVVVEE